MSTVSTEYVCVMNFDHALPDAQAWEVRLLELGLHREAFSIAPSPTGNTILKFWEPNRPEALRILADIDAMHTH